MNDLVYIMLAGVIGYRMGQQAPRKKPRAKRFPTMNECRRPQLSEIPGLDRRTRSFPVIAQDINFYRNLYENPYNYPQ